jgi:hypothetical protein
MKPALVISCISCGYYPIAGNSSCPQCATKYGVPAKTEESLLTQLRNKTETAVYTKYTPIKEAIKGRMIRAAEQGDWHFVWNEALPEPVQTWLKKEGLIIKLIPADNETVWEICWLPSAHNKN